MIKATLARNEGGFVIDLFSDEVGGRSVTITVKEKVGEEESGMELEVATSRSLIEISEESVVVRNKFGDEVTLLLPE
jgi:hypothetical protein